MLQFEVLIISISIVFILIFFIKRKKNQHLQQDYNEIYLNVEKGLETLATQKLFFQVAKSFYEDYSQTDLKKVESIQKTTHSIYGIAKSLGCDPLAKISKQIELSLDKRLFPQFQKALSLTMVELKKEIEKEIKSNHLDKIPLEESTKEQILDDLKDGLTNKSSQSCKKTIQTIQKYQLNAKDLLLIEKIEQLTHYRKYNEALELLNKL